ncbi:MAG: hypothetical protein ABFS19_00595 [Thermodesulfobacteriota bacterium]
MNYSQVIPDIVSSLPEITGAFLASPNHEILIDQAAHIFPMGEQQHIAETLYAVHSLGSSRFNNITAVQVGFHSLNLCTRILDDGNQLVVIHRPELSTSMLKMTVQLALNSEQGDGDAPVQATVEQEPVVEIEEDDSEADLALVEELLHSDNDLSSLLNAIRDELAKHIGPVVELVFEDALPKWAKNGGAAKERLGELIPGLADELETDADRVEFERDIEKILKQE